MYKSSSFVIALHTIVYIVFFENRVTATMGLSDPLGLNLVVVPTPDIQIPSNPVPPCPGCDQSFKELINDINQIRLFESKKTDRSIAICENNTKVVTKALNGFSCSEEIEKKCDLSYVVFIVSMRDGKMKIIGQGVLLDDCTIYTALAVPVMGEECVWVIYSNNVMKKVICMKDPKKTRNLLSDAVYIVKLIVESNCSPDSASSCTNCCSNCPCVGPGIQTYKQSPTPTFNPTATSILIPGYFITPRDCSSTDYSRKFTLGVLVYDPTGATVSILVPNDPNICGTVGAVFISMDCKVLGIGVGKSGLVFGAASAVAVAQEVDPRCVLIILPIES